MEKFLAVSHDDFAEKLASVGRAYGCDVSIPLKYPPSSYPCVVCYFTRDIDSMRWATDLWSEYVYPSDFSCSPT